MLVELKNGQTFNGRLLTCDSFMNIVLKEVIWTSRSGDRFWKIAQSFIRGNTIKYICVSEEVLKIAEKEVNYSENQSGGYSRGGKRGGYSDRGGRGGRGSSNHGRGNYQGGNYQGGQRKQEGFTPRGGGGGGSGPGAARSDVRGRGRGSY